jgi:hypothetical protein
MESDGLHRFVLLTGPHRPPRPGLFFRLLVVVVKSVEPHACLRNQRKRMYKDCLVLMWSKYVRFVSELPTQRVFYLSSDDFHVWRVNTWWDPQFLGQGILKPNHLFT